MRSATTTAPELEERQRIRARVPAVLAARMAPVDLRPLEELEDVPPFAREIIRELLERFRREHPAGLPSSPAAAQIVREYCATARRLYDLEQARQDGMPGQPDLIS